MKGLNVNLQQNCSYSMYKAVFITQLFSFCIYTMCVLKMGNVFTLFSNVVLNF